MMSKEENTKIVNWITPAAGVLSWGVVMYSTANMDFVFHRLPAAVL